MVKVAVRYGPKCRRRARPACGVRWGNTAQAAARNGQSRGQSRYRQRARPADTRRLPTATHRCTRPPVGHVPSASTVGHVPSASTVGHVPLVPRSLTSPRLRRSVTSPRIRRASLLRERGKATIYESVHPSVPPPPLPSLPLSHPSHSICPTRPDGKQPAPSLHSRSRVLALARAPALSRSRSLALYLCDRSEQLCFARWGNGRWV